MLWSDSRVAVPQATKWLPDSRVDHYWDAQRQTVGEYARVLEVREQPWDVYFLYDRDAEWKEHVPKPVYWMDQIGLENSTPFDAVKLRAQVQQLLHP